MQRTNPITYLLEDYRGQSVAGAFYEHELHRATHPDVYLVEEVLCRKGNKVYVNWNSMDRTIYGYTKTMLFDKILMHIFYFYI